MYNFVSLKSFSKQQTSFRTIFVSQAYSQKHSNNVVRFLCRNYTASCIRKTYRYQKFKAPEHQSVLWRTGKPIEGTLWSWI